MKEIVTALLPLAGKPERRSTPIATDRMRLWPSNPSRFVTVVDGIGDTEGESRDGKRQVSREGSEFQIHVSVLENFSQKKACHVFFYSLNPGELLRKKSVDSFLPFQVQGTFTPKIHPH
jgi:hypothetical protein